jgi:PadR family transcriptional regulator, regulatory protein PadR
MLREFFLGFIKLHILYHSTKEAVCGVDLADELRRHGYQISPGTLYPTLHAMQRSGYLEREERTVSGRHRVYYRATKQGVATLKKAKAKVMELTKEIMEEEDYE